MKKYRANPHARAVSGLVLAAPLLLAGLLSGCTDEVVGPYTGSIAGVVWNPDGSRVEDAQITLLYDVPLGSSSLGSPPLVSPPLVSPPLVSPPLVNPKGERDGVTAGPAAGGPPTTAAEPGETGDGPRHPFFAPNYPNPFRAETTIPLDLPAGTVSLLRICDQRGEAVLQVEDLGEDVDGFVWDGRNAAGERLPNGYYFAWLRVSPTEETDPELGWTHPREEYLYGIFLNEDALQEIVPSAATGPDGTFGIPYEGLPMKTLIHLRADPGSGVRDLRVPTRVLVTACHEGRLTSKWIDVDLETETFVELTLPSG